MLLSCFTLNMRYAWALSLTFVLCPQLNDKYHDFVTDPEREEFTAILQQVEDWLYEDGEDETKGVYVAKLEELKKVCCCTKSFFFSCVLYLNLCYLQRGDPIEFRYKEHSERGTVIDQLVYCINSYREAANSNDSKFDHIDVADKQKVIRYSLFAVLMIKRVMNQSPYSS